MAPLFDSMDWDDEENNLHVNCKAIWSPLALPIFLNQPAHGVQQRDTIGGNRYLGVDPTSLNQFPTTDAKFTISCIPAAYWYVFVSGPLMHTPVPAAVCERRRACRKRKTTSYFDQIGMSPVTTLSRRWNARWNKRSCLVQRPRRNVMCRPDVFFIHQFIPSLLLGRPHPN